MEVAFYVRRRSRPAWSRGMSKDAPFALLAVAVIVLAGVLPGFAQALGLGEVTSQSTLGERLRVVVPLTGATGESVSDDCFTLISATEISDVTPTFLTAKVGHERSAQSRLVITTAHPINEPLLRLRFHADY